MSIVFLFYTPSEIHSHLLKLDTICEDEITAQKLEIYFSRSHNRFEVISISSDSVDKIETAIKHPSFDFRY